METKYFKISEELSCSVGGVADKSCRPEQSVNNDSMVITKRGYAMLVESSKQPAPVSVPTVEEVEREKFRLIQVIDAWATRFDIPLKYAKNKRTCFEELLDGILTDRMGNIPTQAPKDS